MRSFGKPIVEMSSLKYFINNIISKAEKMLLSKFIM